MVTWFAPVKKDPLIKRIEPPFSSKFKRRRPPWAGSKSKRGAIYYFRAAPEPPRRAGAGARARFPRTSMAVSLVYYPDPILKRRAAPLARIDDEVRERVREMFAILYREKGIGLAAPQVGWSVRLFVANVT